MLQYNWRRQRPIVRGTASKSSASTGGRREWIHAGSIGEKVIGPGATDAKAGRPRSDSRKRAEGLTQRSVAADRRGGARTQRSIDVRALRGRVYAEDMARGDSHGAHLVDRRGVDGLSGMPTEPRRRVLRASAHPGTHLPDERSVRGTEDPKRRGPGGVHAAGTASAVGRPMAGRARGADHIAEAGPSNRSRAGEGIRRRGQLSMGVAGR